MLRILIQNKVIGGGPPVIMFLLFDNIFNPRKKRLCRCFLSSTVQVLVQKVLGEVSCTSVAR